MAKDFFSTDNKKYKLYDENNFWTRYSCLKCRFLLNNFYYKQNKHSLHWQVKMDKKSNHNIPVATLYRNCWLLVNGLAISHNVSITLISFNLGHVKVLVYWKRNKKCIISTFWILCNWILGGLSYHDHLLGTEKK